MTIRKRLFWSNLFMILLPAAVTVLVGLLCVGAVWLTLTYGTDLGISDREDFDRVCTVVTQMAEKRLEHGDDLSGLEAFLGSNDLALSVLDGSEILYSCGASGREEDQTLLNAAAQLGGDVIVTWDGRSLFLREIEANGQNYRIVLFGGSQGKRGLKPLKMVLALCAAVVGAVIFLSILFTNRFLTKFVFRRIEEPLDVLTRGVHQLRDGNLDYRISYDRQDEFLPICQDFNEMTGRLKDSVQQLQNQERSRKTLLAGISHDIRSPLTSIQAYVEGLLDGVAQTPQMQQRYLTTIKSKAEDIDHLVSQLFLFSKMELGEYPEERREVRLDECIRDAAAACGEECRRGGLDVALELESAVITADPVQLRRIVGNIIENSVKYKDRENGKLKITLHAQNGQYVLCFADDGPGVPEEALPHLFEAFYRSDPARQDPHKGSGLGLAIVAGAVQQLGGTAAAENGCPGLKITILLPKRGAAHGENTDR